MLSPVFPTSGLNIRKSLFHVLLIDNIFFFFVKHFVIRLSNVDINLSCPGLHGTQGQSETILGYIFGRLFWGSWNIFWQSSKGFWLYFVEILCVLLTQRTPGQVCCSLQISRASVLGAVNTEHWQVKRSEFRPPPLQRNWKALWEEEWIVFWKGLQHFLDLNGVKSWDLFSEKSFSSKLAHAELGGQASLRTRPSLLANGQKWPGHM